MSDVLVPIALSSEIDASGNERIHAAPYVANERARWVYTPPYNDSYLLSITSGNINGGGGSGYSLAYSKYNKDTNALESVSKIDTFRTNFGTNLSARSLNNYVFVSGMYSGLSPCGVYAYSLNNSNQLTQRAFWQHPTKPNGTVGSLEVVEVGGEIHIYFIYWGPSFSDRYELICLRFDPNTQTFTKIGDTTLSNSITLITSTFQYQFPRVIYHNGYIITGTYENGLTPDDGTVVSGSMLRAYTFNGSAFTLANSMPLTLSQFNRPGPGRLTQFGDYITLGGNYNGLSERKPIIKMPAGTMLNFTQSPSISGSVDSLIPLTGDGKVFYFVDLSYASPYNLRIYSSDSAGTLTLEQTLNEGYLDYNANRLTVGDLSGVPRIYLALFDTFSANASGVYDWDGTSFVRKGSCVLPGSSTIYNEYLCDLQEIPQLTPTGP